MSQRHNKVVGGNDIEQARAIVAVILISIFAIDFAFITRKCWRRSLQLLPHSHDQSNGRWPRRLRGTVCNRAKETWKF